MTDLVEVRNGDTPTTSTIMFSEEFEAVHRDVIKKIKKLTVVYTQVKKEFFLSEFINERGRKYPMYKMTKRGFLTLLMQYGSAKSDKSALLIFNKQQLFITAFEKMEQMLLNQTNTEWLTTREQGKSIGLKETDAIKDFIEYAIDNGSNGAKHYYKHFTNATYKALSLLEHRKPKTRDTLDLLELHQLVIAEDIVTKVITTEMEEKEHYKVIYEKAKIALEKFADSLYLKGRV